MELRQNREPSRKVTENLALIQQVQEETTTAKRERKCSNKQEGARRKAIERHCETPVQREVRLETVRDTCALRYQLETQVQRHSRLQRNADIHVIKRHLESSIQRTCRLDKITLIQR